MLLLSFEVKKSEFKEFELFFFSGFSFDLSEEDSSFLIELPIDERGFGDLPDGVAPERYEWMELTGEF